MTPIPWDQQLARLLVKPLARTPVSPNQITTVSLLLALGAGWLYASGDRGAANWAAGLFVLARFIDHADGELARLTGKSSRFGYYYDYAVGALSSTALFVGIGIGLRDVALGKWLVGAGVTAGLCAPIAMGLALGVEARLGTGARGYPGFGGFELEDGIYLLAPITWLGALMPFLVLAGTGQVIFCFCMLLKFVAAGPRVDTELPTPGARHLGLRRPDAR